MGTTEGTTYRVGVTNRRARGGKLVHAEEPERPAFPYLSVALCGAALDEILYHLRGFNPDHPRACPRCRAKVRRG